MATEIVLRLHTPLNSTAQGWTFFVLLFINPQPNRSKSQCMPTGPCISKLMENCKYYSLLVILITFTMNRIDVLKYMNKYTLVIILVIDRGGEEPKQHDLKPSPIHADQCLFYICCNICYYVYVLSVKCYVSYRDINTLGFYSE